MAVCIGFSMLQQFLIQAVFLPSHIILYHLIFYVVKTIDENLYFNLRLGFGKIKTVALSDARALSGMCIFKGNMGVVVASSP
jgi:hypothetical protein